MHQIIYEVLSVYYFPIFANLNLKELVTTDTLLKAIASPANAGFKRIPKKGKNTPAASGMPIIL